MKILKVVIEKGQMPDGCGWCDMSAMSNVRKSYCLCDMDKEVTRYDDKRHPECPLVEREVSDGD